MPPQYVAEVSEVNFINCDRFRNEKNLTEFTVKTPGFRGMSVLVYFKKLNAFMNAFAAENQYDILRVPAGEEVYLIAFGKKDNGYYYGQQHYTIQKNGTASLALAKVEEEELKKKLKKVAE